MNRRIYKKLCKRAALYLDHCERDEDGYTVFVGRQRWDRRETRHDRWMQGQVVDFDAGHLMIQWYGGGGYYESEWDVRSAWEGLLLKVDAEHGDYDEAADRWVSPDLRTPAKVFALLKTEPPKSRWRATEDAA